MSYSNIKLLPTVAPTKNLNGVMTVSDFQSLFQQAVTTGMALPRKYFDTENSFDPKTIKELLQEVRIDNGVFVLSVAKVITEEFDDEEFKRCQPKRHQDGEKEITTMDSTEFKLIITYDYGIAMYLFEACQLVYDNEGTLVGRGQKSSHEMTEEAVQSTHVQHVAHYHPYVELLSRLDDYFDSIGEAE